MMRSSQQKPLLSLSVFLLIILASCNLPAAPTGPSIEEQAGTLAALTMQANETQQAAETRVPANTPTKVRPTKTFTPELSPTPSETARPLNAPSLQKYNFFCSWNGTNTELEITIQWTDRSDNELGYIVLRDGEEIANLLPNAETYTDFFTVNTGQKVIYTVAAYNNTSGESETFSVSVTCE